MNNVSQDTKINMGKDGLLRVQFEGWDWRPVDGIDIRDNFIKFQVGWREEDCDADNNKKNILIDFLYKSDKYNETLPLYFTIE